MGCDGYKDFTQQLKKMAESGATKYNVYVAMKGFVGQNFSAQDMINIFAFMSICVDLSTIGGFEERYRKELGQQQEDEMEAFRDNAIKPYILKDGIRTCKPLGIIAYQHCHPAIPLQTVFDNEQICSLQIWAEGRMEEISDCLENMLTALSCPSRIVISPRGGGSNKSRRPPGSLRTRNIMTKSESMMVLDHSHKYEVGNVMEKMFCYCEWDKCSTKVKLTCENVVLLEKIMEMYYVKNIMQGEYYPGFTLEDLKKLCNRGSTSSYSFIAWARFFQAIFGLVTDTLTLPVIVFKGRGLCDIEIGLVECDTLDVVSDASEDNKAEKLFDCMIGEGLNIGTVSQYDYDAYQARRLQERESRGTEDYTVRMIEPLYEQLKEEIQSSTSLIYMHRTCEGIE